MKPKTNPPDLPGKRVRPADETQMEGTPSPPAKPTTAQVFLGLFILWQLFFLFGSNLIDLIGEVRNDTSYQKTLPQDWLGVVNKTFPDWMKKEGHLHDAFVVVKDLTRRWAQLTGQPQGWSLFAPEVSKQITFVAVELRWDEPNKTNGRRSRRASYPPELLLSQNEPKDKTKFFRSGKFRLRKYEGNLDVILRVYDDETLEDAVERWQNKIKKKVSEDGDNMKAYLKMRCKEYLSKHRARPWPQQAILVVRRFEIPKPEDFSEDWYKDPRDKPHHQLPIARCLIDREGDLGDVQCCRLSVNKEKHVIGQFVSPGGNEADSRRRDEDNNNDDDDDDED